MEPGIINNALKQFCVEESKSLADVVQYLKMKYRIDADELILKKRLEKLLNQEKAVA
ncbi:MAG: hypothetical protein HWE15_01660 [Algoriphagus sp.]|uniref:hypothetical protein n=1 Tax=Algoriphagus sp. TaxID=1872435 RepID=UPI001843B160|nr:hypothetical protein [Algoriphagus sp.]NVJ84977.1 hypothetical protein [Algoriphagus sp.]